jgi:hypothetical protein
MPPSPDSSLRVINLGTGYTRFNRSWTLGRVFQNYEYWMPAEVEQQLQNHPVLYQDEEAGTADTAGEGHGNDRIIPQSSQICKPPQGAPLRRCLRVGAR